ncbi:hypothetical protein F4861DRAFT_505973 [Xylaria intraflava]|nr:hypothetical protein F4861DRAFT_505973 [Xylaria intraflava]
MTPTQQSSTDTRQKIVRLQELLKQPSSKDRVAPLVTALMARDVDLHERMLTDLSKKVQQIEATTRSEKTGRLLERMHNVEQDAKSLRQLITAVDQSVTETKAGQDQLKAELTTVINQNCARIADAEQHLKTIGEMMEQRQQTNSEIMEFLRAMTRNRQSLRRNIDDIQNGLQGMRSTPIKKSITKLIELMAEYLDQTSFIPGISKTNDTSDKSAGNMPTGKGSAGDMIDQSKGNIGSNQNQLQEFPAITEFLLIYDEFIEIYKFTPPKDESKFIETFLGSLNVHISCAVQRQLLKIYPNKVALVTMRAGQQFPNIFIDLNRMDWKTIRHAIPKIKDLRVLQWALNEGLSGPSLNQPSRECHNQHK